MEAPPRETSDRDSLDREWWLRTLAVFQAPRALFVALRDTTLPAHDVHGRATIVQLTWDEIERRFGRR